MKRILLTLIVTLTTLSAYSQIAAGIRDSHYVYGSYTFNKKISVELNHSLYSENMGFQRIGIGAGYSTPLPLGFSCGVKAFGATTWNRNYQVFGAEISAAYTYRRLTLDASINPRYDSGLDYMTCWKAGATVKIIKPIGVTLHYTTIPEFRMSEKRLRGGFEFNVDRLSVRPELSVSVDPGTRFKNMRVLTSMEYRF